jgi:hypothetical protein
VKSIHIGLYRFIGLSDNAPACEAIAVLSCEGYPISFLNAGKSGAFQEAIRSPLLAGHPTRAIFDIKTFFPTIIKSSSWSGFITIQ